MSTTTMLTTTTNAPSTDIDEFYELLEPAIGDLKIHRFPSPDAATVFFTPADAKQATWKVVGDFGDSGLDESNPKVMCLTLRRWRNDGWEYVFDIHSDDLGVLTGWPLRLSLVEIRTYIKLSEERGQDGPDVTPQELAKYIDEAEMNAKLAMAGIG